MAQFTHLLFSGNFATGMTYYQDRYPGQEHSARMVLVVTVERRLSVQAIVDTGAPWCVLNPNLMGGLGLVEPIAHLPEEELQIRGTSYKGRLLRMYSPYVQFFLLRGAGRGVRLL